MIRHKTLWGIAAACVLLAGGIALARYLVEERAARAAAALQSMAGEALRRLEEDPGAAQPETRDALRRAAVAAAEGQLRSAEAHYLLGQQYVREVDYRLAETELRKAIAAAPGWSRPHAALGRLLVRNAVGRREEAEKELLIAAEMDPDYWDPHDSLGIVYRLLGRHEEAYAAARRAVELAPQLVGPHNNLANLLMAMERYDEAEEQYRAAIELDPHHAKPYYNLACLYSRTGRKDEALAQLEAAIQREPVLRIEATDDEDFEPLRRMKRFRDLIAQPKKEADEDAEESPPAS
ncbi:MAG: hypothetical protein RLZZ303_88 [Candidatus Hydrogenedentota bacterium]